MGSGWRRIAMRRGICMRCRRCVRTWGALCIGTRRKRRGIVRVMGRGLSRTGTGVGGVGGGLGNGWRDEHVPPEARELADDLEKMGPVYVKIGQMLSTRPDVLPQAFAEALERLQDKVEPFSFAEVEKIIKEE